MKKSLSDKEHQELLGLEYSLIFGYTENEEKDLKRLKELRKKNMANCTDCLECVQMISEEKVIYFCNFDDNISDEKFNNEHDCDYYKKDEPN